jgi:hypothetical protein
VIERYLEELRRLLGRGPGRARLLAEVEDHLREAARRLERGGAVRPEAERAAVASFGPPAELAAQLSGEQAATAVGWSARLLIVALAGFVPVYGFVENFSPPAPWPSAEATPAHLAWKLAAAQYLVLGAAVVGACVFVLARGYRLRPGCPLGLARGLALAVSLSAVALALGAAVGALELVERNALYRDLGVPDSLTPLEVSLVSAWVGLLGLSALAAAAWSLRRAFAALKPA